MGITTGGGATRSHFDVPVGMIMHCGHANDPGLSVGDWLECNGQNVSRAVYAALYLAIGTTHGIGDGSTTFGLPDARRRSLVGKGGVGTGTLGNAVGNTGGEETHTQAVAELPSHAHPGSVATIFASGSGGGNSNGPPSWNADINAGVSVAAQGSGTAFNEYSPSLVCGVWIKS